MNSISAKRRWCITGTPIQNELADLGALVTFLRVPFLSDMEIFRAYIVEPACHDDSSRYDNLRLLLGCICLRRTKDSGHLADPKIEIERLSLSSAEKKTYNQIVHSHKNELDKSISTNNSVPARGHIFRVLLKLRILCNHGVYRTFRSSNSQLDADEYFSFLQLRNEARCFFCAREVWFLADSLLPEAGVFAQCRHLICGSCAQISMQFHSLHPSTSQKCFSCLSSLAVNPCLMAGSPGGALTPIGSSPNRSPSPIPDFVYPTKIGALLHNIKLHQGQKWYDRKI